ncbi:ROK family protein [Limnoraphis robusta Tam1]|uniref:ROK family protein n=1 Tax=Limnoraphis robusta CCNP1315 TaxID=3110306 RepID=A0ABU5U7W7_9CYAN|nr:ROK family protein [Limnoraphis robusta]MEA5523095.1 ROK family protein [Limnoraphis robusta CCNP1315]MEA5537894.1 ROK family protein [Limnoraphis robusta Tam1]MEA5548083.1 ROK family protein [Limnoraphis robusta CCNP1324]
MVYVLGIDGGGTKTVCLLMDETGNILSRGKSGSSNYQTIGIDATKIAIQTAINKAIYSFLDDKNYKKISIQGLGIGLAGVGRQEDFNVINNLVEQVKINLKSSINWELTANSTRIKSDSIIALVGGLGHSVGIVVIAGTGSQIFGQNSQGKTKRVGGWGYLLGDEGSGYFIAISGLKAALKSYDGRLSSTQLISAFKHHLNLTNIESLIEVVYRRGWTVQQIASLAKIVDQVARDGDEIANHIINTAIEELVFATKIAIQSLFEPDETVEIVTIGGVFQGMNHFHSKYIESLNRVAPTAKVILPRYEPAYGAGILALNGLGYFPH